MTDLELFTAVLELIDADYTICCGRYVEVEHTKSADNAPDAGPDHPTITNFDFDDFGNFMGGVWHQVGPPWTDAGC